MGAPATTHFMRVGVLTSMIVVFAAPAAMAQQVRIAVTAIVENAAFDAVRNGLADGLREGGFADGHNLQLLFESADASPAEAARIARRMAAIGPDVTVAISAPSAVAAAREATLSRIVFTAVGPRAGLPMELRDAAAAGRARGLATSLPIAETLSLVKEISPGAATIGLLFAAGSDQAIARVRRVAHALDLQIVAPPLAVAESAEVAQSLVGRVDAVVILPGTNAEFDAIIEFAEANMMPVYAFDAALVAGGAIAATGHDHYELGRQTSALVLRLLNDEPPASGAIADAKATRLVINPDAAERMGVKMPAGMVERAHRIFD